MTEAEGKTYEVVGRVTERHSCRLKVRYRILQSVPSMGLYHDRDVYEDGWLRNRSHGGVLLEACHHIHEGLRLELNFKSPDGRFTYRAETIARWVRKLGERDFHIGLEFQDMQEL